MINNLLQNISTIYIAYGVTDFRKQIPSLCSLVRDKFNMDPYESSAVIFCNRKRDSIKVLCYDRNGFVLAQKKLVGKNSNKFQWPRNSEELKSITKEQLSWLLSGLQIYRKKYFKDVKMNNENIAI